MQKETEHLPSLILASSSPRRQEMLLGLGLTFRMVKPEVDESPLSDERPDDYAARAARDKAHGVAEHLKTNAHRKVEIIIAGDTAVVLSRKILGKPNDEEDARNMLRALSGKTHEVISGLCVLGLNEGKSFRERTVTVTTEVQFRELSDAEIHAYVAGGEPMDKAGAYAIQGGANYMVKRIDGSHTNVIGLPLCELVEILTEEFDYHWF